MWIQKQLICCAVEALFAVRHIVSVQNYCISEYQEDEQQDRCCDMCN
jgi:hypothetical protein